MQKFKINFIPKTDTEYHKIFFFVDDKSITENYCFDYYSDGERVDLLHRYYMSLSPLDLADWLMRSFWYHMFEAEGENAWGEPDYTDFDWRMMHKMTAIGGGSIWPNITICRDGENVKIKCAAYKYQYMEYVCDDEFIISRENFEQEVVNFVNSMMESFAEYDYDWTDFLDMKTQFFQQLNENSGG